MTAQQPAPASEEDRLALRHVDNWHRRTMGETWLGQTTVLLRDHWQRPGVRAMEADQWWLICDATAVAYLHTATHLTRTEYQHVLCDIEVRDNHRRNGHARRIIDAAQDVLGAPLHTTGSFTPLGAPALTWLPVLPWEQPGIKFGDMPFVADWDNLRPISPL